MFLVACFSLSFTESPPVGLPIYEDVGFAEIYHESLRFVALAKGRFDDLVENVKQWSMDFVSYLSQQKSLFNPTQKLESLQFFNLTMSSTQEEFQFNRHIGTDYIQQVQEFEEETKRMEEEDEVVTEEIDDESEVVDEDVTEEPLYEQIETDADDVVTQEPINEQIRSDVDEVQETKLNLGDVQETKEEATHEAQSDMVLKDVEIESSVADSLSTRSIATICVAGFSMVVMAASAVVYMKQKKSNASKSAPIRVNNDNMREESGSSETSISSVQKGNKKKTNNKRESLASSSSEFSMSESFGSFTTFERIAIKHKDEALLTPIRRSSRLSKNQPIAS